MASLIAVDQCLGLERNTVIPDEELHRLQHKVDLERIADDICQKLLCECVENGGHVASFSRRTVWQK